MIIHKRVESMLPVASKEPFRAVLQKVYVSLEEAVVTDGNMLVRTSLDNTVEMPAAPGETMTEPVLVDLETIKKAIGNLPKKPHLPCNNYIRITKDGEQCLVNSGVPVSSFPVSCEQEAYPNYKAVIPDYTDKQPVKFALNAKLLKKVCDMAIKHGNGSNHQITFEIPSTEPQVKRQENGLDPVVDANGDPVFENVPVERLTTGLKFVIPDNNNNEVFTGVVMPLRVKG